MSDVIRVYYADRSDPWPGFGDYVDVPIDVVRSTWKPVCECGDLFCPQPVGAMSELRTAALVTWWRFSW